MAVSVASHHKSRSTTTLSPEDLQNFATLGISPGLLKLAGVERVTDGEARENFGITFQGDLAGIVFPYYLHGKRVTARLRRDHPERDIAGKIENKYISAKGDRRHLYLPPDSLELLEDQRIPLLFVEAEKSVLAVVEWARRIGRKILPMGCGGCWGWRGQVGIQIKPDGEREPEKGPLPEIAFAREGRTCGILFDVDAATNLKVAAARTALKEQLEKQGATVLVMNLPALAGVNGVDDYIAVAGDQALNDLLTGKAPNPDNEIDLRLQPLNDYGNALRLLALHSDDLRYCPPMKKWLRWDGRRWVIDDSDQVRKLAQDVMVCFVQQAFRASDKPLLRFAGESLNSHRITAALREAQPHRVVAAENLDTHPWLLNFRNGTMDLRTGELMPHSREHLLTKLVHYNYSPDAQCPAFHAFLERSVDPSLIRFLQKAAGYSLTGITSEKTNFLLLGPTNTGKTTYLDLRRELYQEYSTLIEIDALMQRDSDNNSRADVADLRGARFVMTSEVEQGQRLREAKLKRITQGQGKIKAVRKYEHWIQFQETHKIFIDANHKPIVRGTDDSIWNRLTPIPFDRPLAETEIDRELPAKLRQEAEGIIRWEVAGVGLWRQEGLGRPPEVEAARASWRSEMDRLKQFRQELCIENPSDPNLEVQARPLYQAYKKWSEDAGEKPVSETMFGLRMMECGFKKAPREKGAFYLGVALKDLFHG
ncbi:MAG: phage/plasmid primase, P4 family [Candidatus Acidiferrales bacterium]